MHPLDYLVLALYFLVMVGIGVYSSMRVKAQEDFFMGGRSFGKLLQTFAAFGAGTGSADPVNTGRTTFTSGLSGMWSVMYWLFVTPFYWITGVWYRRMRHLTLGDWFVERYESKALGAGYCVFGILFYMVYGSMMFSAIGKVAAPLIGISTVGIGGTEYGIEYVLVPIIGVVVVIYGIAGGLAAAYYTDLIQGICIILLSIILIPYGLQALVDKFGDPATDTLFAGFRIMHEQVPPEYFSVVGSTSSSEFPLYRIIAVVIINLIGIVVQPHFIATGGGSAKNENSARVGLVVGNFLKRFCTVGWVLTALIALALFADQPELVADPDLTWGYASKQLLGPGLTGLMLACLLAALMSSVDAYMIVGSGLMVRNVYAPYFNPNASEKQYVRVARLTGILVVAGAVIISLNFMDVFLQLQLTWIFNILYATPFWVGMYWRRATTTAAWWTVAYCVVMFFLLPMFIPLAAPSLQYDSNYTGMNEMVQTTTIRKAAPSDVEQRMAAIQIWEGKSAAAIADPAAQAELGKKPASLEVGDSISESKLTGGKAIFWDSVKPVNDEGEVLAEVKPVPVGKPEQIDPQTTRQVLAYAEGTRLKGFGNFNPDFLLYQWLGVDLKSRSNAMLATMELPPKIITPFLVMILISLMTRPNSREALDRYYTKMKTPVVADHEADAKAVQEAYENRETFEQKKLFPGTSLEFQRPRTSDVVGFVVCFIICFAIIGLAMGIANLGA